jgi:hypothetical protein
MVSRVRTQTGPKNFWGRQYHFYIACAPLMTALDLRSEAKSEISQTESINSTQEGGITALLLHCGDDLACDEPALHVERQL